MTRIHVEPATGRWAVRRGDVRDIQAPSGAASVVEDEERERRSGLRGPAQEEQQRQG